MSRSGPDGLAFFGNKAIGLACYGFYQYPLHHCCAFEEDRLKRLIRDGDLEMDGQFEKKNQQRKEHADEIDID